MRSLDISYDDIMDTLKEVQTTVPESSEETEAAKLAFTPLVISVMERSFRVARENNQTYVSTEHLLIGIVEEGNGMAMDILMRLGVSSASIKKAIEKLTAKDQDKKRPLAAPVLVVPVRACRSLAVRMPLSKRGVAPIRLNSSRPTSRRRRATASSIR